MDDLRALHNRLPGPEQTETGLKVPSALKLSVECWLECQQYGEELRQMCDPGRDTELDDRLKGVYGRSTFRHSSWQACSRHWTGSITSDEVPTATVEHWQAGQVIAENWRLSAHRLLEQLDHSGEAVQEKRQQDRMLAVIRENGVNGCTLRDLYRKLHLTAKVGRQTAQELVKANLVAERRIKGAEAYLAIEYIPTD